MIVLALDTALGACQCALLRDDDTVLVRAEPTVRGGSERLVGLVDAVLAEAGIGYGDIGRVAVTTGPGSFTGVRIALAYTRGLALARPVPVVGVTTLEAFAAGMPAADDADVILAVVDARHGAVFAQPFDTAGVALEDPAYRSVDALADAIGSSRVRIVGDVAEAVATHLGAAGARVIEVMERSAPDPIAIARLGRVRLATGPLPLPVYLKPADAVPSRPMLRLARC